MLYKDKNIIATSKKRMLCFYAIIALDHTRHLLLNGLIDKARRDSSMTWALSQQWIVNILNLVRHQS